MGSQMNVGAGVRREEVGVGDDSSPRNLKSGYLDFSDEETISSTALSVSVTRSEATALKSSSACIQQYQNRETVARSQDLSIPQNFRPGQRTILFRVHGGGIRR